MTPLPIYAIGSQDSVVITPEEANEIRARLAELEGLRVEVAALKAARTARDGEITALEDLVAATQRLADEWKTAAEARHDANDKDAALEASLQKSLDEARAEIDRVRAERDAARRHHKFWGIGGVLAGVAIAIAAVHH